MPRPKGYTSRRNSGGVAHSHTVSDEFWLAYCQANYHLSVKFKASFSMTTMMQHVVEHRLDKLYSYTESTVREIAAINKLTGAIAFNSRLEKYVSDTLRDVRLHYSKLTGEPLQILQIYRLAILALSDA